ncbi:ROK family transcriptional regulator [Microbacterium sp. NPDC058342]|uniref:ROK family transcriptional regulator n=1 Tax=Microbacterium sp. NPDC058342 TaxID=3346454 RepID=UPI00364C844D
MQLNSTGPAGLKDMRRSNELTVLNCLYQGGDSTRTAIARQTGLTKPTVSAALGSLIAVGLAERVEDAPAPTKYGADVFRAAGRSFPVLGVDVGTRFIRAELAGLDDQLLATADEEVRDPTIEQVIDAIVRLRDRTAQRAGVPPESLQAVGVGIPGVMPPGSDRVAMAGGVSGLEGFPLRSVLEDRLGLRVLLENDVNVAAIGEHRYGVGVDRDDFAILSVGAGVGSALVLGGKVLRGRRGSAGELDLLFRLEQDGRGLADPASEAMTAWATERLELRPQIAHPLPIHLPDLFDAAAQGDEFAQSVVDETATRVADLCACLVAVVDVDTIVLAGGIGGALEPGRDALEGRLAELVPWPTEILQSSLGRSGNVKGARALAVETARAELFERRIGKTLSARAR